MNRYDTLMVLSAPELPRVYGDEPMKKAIHFVEGVSAPYIRG